MEGPPRALSSQAMGLSRTGAGCDFNIVTCWHVPVLKSSACEGVACVAGLSLSLPWPCRSARGVCLSRSHAEPALFQACPC